MTRKVWLALALALVGCSRGSETSTVAPTAPPSAAPSSAPRRYRVSAHADGKAIGTFELDDKTYLKVLRDDSGGDLEQEAAALNKQPTLSYATHCAGPNGSRGALCTRTVERGSPDAINAIIDSMDLDRHWDIAETKE